MPPNNTLSPVVTTQVSQSQKDTKIASNYETLWGYFKTPVKWTNVTAIFFAHILASYALLTLPNISHWKTFCWNYFLGVASAFGVTAGVHRLWTHKSYTARLPLRIILAILFTTTGQNSFYDWIRDHRLHHKFSETDADPHNIKRGFFFAHVGWLMMKRHPKLLEKSRQIDCRDILEDPVVVFFQKHFSALKLVLGFILPMAVPYFCWNETIYWSFMLCIARYMLTLNFIWTVNSVAHMFGNKPYNKNINSTESLFVSVFTMGEGWHNYHHTFPSDYKAAELENYRANVTILFIDLCAKLGLAYDLKTSSKEFVQKTVLMNGDGSHKLQ